ncbi:hypothetical protein FRX31_005912 [Thalictrum thalictroides]|uniref:Uncharacterized protein n=1 Tax=Thalictrum thalictroides TaxID=46969 RepID=A0A7J6X816_THATH|nr:hypothetical protein FRX31_005912 [Thalictrum thalictroides]
MLPVFKEGVRCKLGNSIEVSFWHLWLRERMLSVRFPLLYTLPNARNGKVNETSTKCIGHGLGHTTP